MSQVVIKGKAFSNITYEIYYETGYTPEEWAGLSDKEKSQIYDEAVYSDIDLWDEVVE
jgi:hypothetical protein